MCVIAGENEDVSTTSKWCRKEPVQDSRAELLLKASSLIAGRPKRTLGGQKRQKAADNDEEGEKVGELSSTDSDVVISCYNYSD
jgi:hypothetical protein